MARSRGGRRSPERLAADVYSSLPSSGMVPEDLLPERPGLEAEYRWLVAVGYQDYHGGPPQYITVEVLSATNLSLEEIRGLAEIEGVDVASRYSRSGPGGGGPVVLPGTAAVLWAARRA